MKNAQWIRRVCDSKDQAMLLISRLEGVKLVFYSRNNEYVVEHERECHLLEGEYSVITEEQEDRKEITNATDETE